MLKDVKRYKQGGIVKDTLDKIFFDIIFNYRLRCFNSETINKLSAEAVEFFPAYKMYFSLFKKEANNGW